MALQRAAQFLLVDVEDLDLQHLVGFGVVHHIVQAAPRAFQALEVFVVNDQIHLL
ncbi:hypothetical protein SDC9_126566 [bioreactor metagenome]|uniref:Uncharacterized protein n=1 Tax=bioreactor metagenome TaxID=1076179 RepID=A0A645CRL6_9ZZZZ